MVAIETWVSSAEAELVQPLNLGLPLMSDVSITVDRVTLTT